MILVDSSIWIDHLCGVDDRLQMLLDAHVVIMHPFVIGEIALGHLKSRETTMRWLSDLPQIFVATEGEVARIIVQHALFGAGIGYVDVHLLASTSLSSDTQLWTRDKRLRIAGQRLGVATD